MACREPNGSCGCKQNEPLVGLNDTARETDDDVWADDDEAGYSMKDQSTADLKRIHTKQGYLDGLTQAQESGLQQGFDEAFPKGAQLGIEVGRLLSRIWCYKDVRTDLFEQAKQDKITGIRIAIKQGVPGILSTAVILRSSPTILPRIF
ncbi:hypothetical protein QCA50_016256 [Cerrena zonata]|uniref:Protein YAE1 n=1 Tax=Cerrena zonata TaxID=2478898 RepID=A0AAW0FT26_9APHY